LPDGRVTFRLCASDAVTAKVVSTDLPDIIPMGFPSGPKGLAMTKAADGLWSVTTPRPVPADTYRFDFEIDGVTLPDPQGTHFSETRVGTNSTFEVTGPAGDFQAWHKGIPHGAVTIVHYWSSALGIERRMHIYTPAGYMKGNESYPVLYLVHGAGDSDDSWTSIGHADRILDTLIAAGKAAPMIVVMPFGHTPDRPGADMLDNTDFGADLFNDVIPYVEAYYRTVPTADARAMAGLSMGGAHTIRFGLTHPETFHWIGIFSMGLGMQGPDEVARYEAANGPALTRDSHDMKLVYYAIGTQDFLYRVSAPTRTMLDKYDIPYVYHESGGGHSWINWRRYLADFVPRLFR
jgi:enterochelin esterase family protein